MKEKAQKRGTTVKKKMIAFGISVIVIMLIISVLSLAVMTMINNLRSERYDYYGKGMTDIVQAYASLNQVKASERNVLFIYSQPSEEQQENIALINQQFETVNECFDAFARNLEQYDSDIQTAFASAKESIGVYQEGIQNVIGLVKDNKIEEGIDNLINVDMNAVADATTALDKLTAALDEASVTGNNEINRWIMVLRCLVIVICVIGILIALFKSLKLIKSVTVPVAGLNVASKKMALGDVDVQLEKVSNDDLGDLIDEFGVLADAVRSQAEIAYNIAGGDLTVQVEPRSDKDLLGKALYKLVKDNNRTLGNVKESTIQVTVGAEQVASASQALAQGATQQASALEEVTASVNEIAEHTKQNASEANHADELVNDVKDKAASGNGQMKSMIGAMDEINEASEMVAKVIKVIDDISFQTNILALNAAVEAARAGVHGKGFAVVAEEVRNLAGKSAAAAAETAEIIEGTIQKIGHGTQLAEDTANSLDEIVNSIDKVSELVSAIATASNDQATAVSQVDQAIEQVSQVVQTNSATSEQCAAASEELSNQAANLRSLMANFKLTPSNKGGLEPEPNEEQFNSSDSFNSNEQIISLDEEFGKY